MQFKIPQDVQRPDTIIGPITFAQLGICLVGGSIDYAIYIALANTYKWFVWAIPVGIIGLLTVAIAFLKIGDMSFARFVLFMYEYLFKPRNRLWKKDEDYYYSILKSPIKLDTAEAEIKGISDDELQAKKKKLQEISKILDQ